VLPVFGIILAGYLCGRFGLLGEASSEALNRFVYFLALPALFFISTARVGVADVLNWRFLAAMEAASSSPSWSPSPAPAGCSPTAWPPSACTGWRRSSPTPAIWAFRCW
jgi:hypothetical protein